MSKVFCMIHKIVIMILRKASIMKSIPLECDDGSSGDGRDKHCSKGPDVGINLEGSHGGASCLGCGR